MKFGGRTKGTPNKVTKEIRETLLSLVNKHLVNDIENLPPNKRLDALIRLLPYVVPPIKNESIEHDSIEPLVIIVQRDESNPDKSDAEYIRDYNSSK
jgi:hypothetical protein